ncbi:RING-type E3 ubiquitin transferase [Salvia divinorum]|uniref:E3 ubiquitin-protein ligase RMA n=1 Tax=Salvia divinorum TaxID=28513 RepID=A0ABD1HZU0_SALDI
MDDFIDVSLNEEPIDSSVAQANESETSHERVEERIRQLQGVTFRAGERQRQSQRCERNPVGIRVVFSDALVNTDVESGIPVETDDVGTVDKTRESGCKRDRSHLVGEALASALAMDSPAKKGDKEGGSFYDCNICLELVRDPVLTCCGHLFCWACYYQVEYVDSRSKECPVCEGEVTDGNVIPIYGNNGGGGGEGERETASCLNLKVPPRPKARRIERATKRD